MKKINLISVCGILFILAFTNDLVAQDGASLTKPATKPAGDMPFVANTPEQKVAFTKSAVKEARANERVTSYIVRHFKNISSLRVANLKEGAIVAEFSIADKAAKVVYNKKGNPIYSIINYGENGLPAEVKRLVNNEFKEYAITLVQEISQRGITCYKLFLKGSSNSKEVFVFNGEITIDKEYTN